MIDPKEWFSAIDDIASILWNDANIKFTDGCCMGYDIHAAESVYIPKSAKIHYRNLEDIILVVESAIRNAGYKTSLSHRFISQKPNSVLVNHNILVSLELNDDSRNDNKNFVDHFNIDYYDVSEGTIKLGDID